ncbi:MAG: hypothetical protein ACTHOK_02960 [Nocardioidaceae bacterium]
MPLTLVREIAVCECCALVIANGDDSGCRDYYGHTHPAPDVPAGTCLTDDGADQPSTPWTCEACGERVDRFAYRMWAAVLEAEHWHEYRRDLADWWCRDCNTVTDFCAQTNPA